MLCIYFPLPAVIRVIGACIALFFTGVCIYVFVERIIEIRSGADAVVNVRYASANVMQGAAEVMAYGTAVKFV